MRVVLDTNVLVSAALKQTSIPGMAVLMVQRRDILLKSSAAERQLLDVLARPYFAGLIDSDTRSWLQRLMNSAEVVEISERIVACRDPTDDKFLELAIGGHADVLVSGDADFARAQSFPRYSDRYACYFSRARYALV